MNINSAIQDWIQNNHDFQQGIKVLSIVDPGHEWEIYRGVAFVPFEQKLALKKRLLKLEVKQVSEKETIYPLENIGLPKPIPTHSIPESILHVKEKCKHLHKAQDLAHSELRVATTKEKRYEIAIKIMETIVPDLKSNYDLIRQWEKTGQEPDLAEMDIVSDTVGKAKQILSISPRISKLKKLISNAQTIEEKSRYEKELDEKQDLLDELKKELKW